MPAKPASRGQSPQSGSQRPDDEAVFRQRVWDLQRDVHLRIAVARENAYRVYPSRESRSLLSKGTTAAGGTEIPQLKQRYYTVFPPQNVGNDLFQFAYIGVNAARDFEEETQKMGVGGAADAFLATMRAGVLLSYSEKILLVVDPSSPPASWGLTSQQRIDLLSEAMTIVATARDQVAAAEGFVENRREEMGSRERQLLLRNWLGPLVLVYLLFDPALRTLTPIASWLVVPDFVRPFWEVGIWSLFGATANSLIAIQFDVRQVDFDPTEIQSYYYRIAVAPFVSFVLIAFLSLVGFQSSGVELLINLASPNYPLLVILAFITGFFGKRAIEALGQVWKRTISSS